MTIVKAPDVVGRPRNRRSLKLIYVLIPLIALSSLFSGCVQTKLELPTRMPEIERLAAINGVSLGLVIAPIEESKLGNQFVFGALPLGSITLPDIELGTREQFYKELAIRGFRPLTGLSIKDAPEQVLLVTVQSLALNGFDLLLTRRISCALQLNAQLRTPSSLQQESPLRYGTVIREATITHRESSYARYAFAPDLSKTLVTCFEVGAKRLLHELRLKPNERRSETLTRSIGAPE